MSDNELLSDLTFRRTRLLPDSGVASDKEFDNAQICASIDANVVCSDLESNQLLPGERLDSHYLVLDIDYPINVIKSSSGNNHVYFGKTLSQDALFEILRVLSKHGVVQQGWVDSAETRGYATLRAPGISKNEPEDFRSLDENGQIETQDSYVKALSALKKRKRPAL